MSKVEHYTNIGKLLENLRDAAYWNPNCKVSCDDDDAARVVGFRVETESGKALTLAIRAEDMKKTTWCLRERWREALPPYLASPLGRKEMIESLQRAAQAYWARSDS